MITPYGIAGVLVLIGVIVLIFHLLFGKRAQQLPIDPNAAMQERLRIRDGGIIGFKGPAPKDPPGERVVGKHPALGMGYPGPGQTWRRRKTNAE